MANNKASDHDVDQETLDKLLADNDTGGRQPKGVVGELLLWLAFIWSVFQLWIASPFPYMVSDIIPVLNNTGTRSIHLAFGLLLAFMAYPASKKSPRNHVPVYDWILAILGVVCTMYLYVYSRELANRPGLPILPDIITAAIGIVLVLMAAYRSLGAPLVVIAGIFLAYVFFGHLGPEVIAWKGASFSKAMTHLWITQQGIFGIALGVSTSMVFMFVLFGSLLERAGAGNYFIWVAFSLLGHLKGGPAKAAVISSGLTGLVSGSSIANVVTTGTFTIPLMKRVGFSSEKAGAVEVASSTNGQLTPPVMGAAAFLMIEFVGISYIEVIKHAFLPAIISYIALVYIVHLEACKLNLSGMERAVKKTFLQSMLTFMTVVVGMVAASLAMHYSLGWMKGAFGEATPWIAGVIGLGIYIWLLKVAVVYPELGRSDEIEVLPVPGPVVKSGLYFLIPVVLLMWCLTVERLSPGLSAFWASLAMIFVLITHKPLKAMFRKQSMEGLWGEGVHDFREGMISGARNMISIAIATATAGIIIGTVTLTGVGLVMAEFVEFISGGNLIFMLVFTAGISLLLGMGLPTTANYIVVSSLMAPVIVELGAQSGLIVPLIAVHLFVFYFGILADDTPPVGLAAYAAAAISGGDPIRTGIQGFTYDIRTGILPFMFLFNTELLMIGITGPVHLVMVVVTAVVAMLLFAAATQGWFLTRSKHWETGLLLLAAFIFIRPGFLMDKIYPPLVTEPATRIYDIAETAPVNGQIRVHVTGETLEGKAVDKVVMLPLGEAGLGKDRLINAAGLELREDGEQLVVDNLAFGGVAEKQKLDFDYVIEDIQVKADRPAKHWFYLLAIGLLALIVMSQMGRIRKFGHPVPLEAD